MAIDDASRLPPNQHWAAPGKWPMVGEVAPRADQTPWKLTIRGLVESASSWTLEDLRSLPQKEVTLDLHCVTRWSLKDATFRGVDLSTLLDHCRPTAAAIFASFVSRSERRHSSSLPLAEAVALRALVALDFADRPLTTAHGGPLRLMVPGKYLYKSVKWVETIELLAEDRLGHWEATAGYHNGADPWREERYIAADLSRFDVAKLLSSRNFAGLNLLSIVAASLPLANLNAADALLRNADFQKADLRGAVFDRANLTNARFVGANVRDASFRDADVEGADFCAADLRGADFRGASLIAATFIGADHARAANMDATTKFTRPSLENLTPSQREFVERSATIE